MGNLHPQMKQILELLERRSVGKPPLWELSADEARTNMEADHAEFWNDGPAIASIVDRQINGPRGPISVRHYIRRTDDPAPCLLFFHGGGFVIGSINTHDSLCRRLALDSGFDVMSVGYRLAPENKFPAALDDCVASVRWVSSHGPDLFVDPSRLFIGGDSAGANLALSTAIALRDKGDAVARGLVLAYGNYETDLDTSSMDSFGSGDYYLSKRDMEWFQEQYVNSAADLSNPLVAPLHADFRTLPPLFLAAAEFDPLLDSSRRLIERLRDMRVPHEQVLWRGVTHACLNMTRLLDPARVFLREIAYWLQREAKRTEDLVAKR